jgi:hypothetical protein
MVESSRLWACWAKPRSTSPLTQHFRPSSSPRRRNLRSAASFSPTLTPASNRPTPMASRLASSPARVALLNAPGGAARITEAVLWGRLHASEDGSGLLDAPAAARATEGRCPPPSPAAAADRPLRLIMFDGRRLCELVEIWIPRYLL